MKHQKGFTLIELLVVIAIIGLLSSVVLASLNTARAKARDAKRVAELNQIKNALELYRNDNSGYPIASCISSPWWNCWGSAGENRLVPSSYMPVMPQDPSFADAGNACSSRDGSRLYAYYSDNGQRYYLVTNLERTVSASDPNYYNGTYGCTAFGNWAINNGF